MPSPHTITLPQYSIKLEGTAADRTIELLVDSQSNSDRIQSEDGVQYIHLGDLEGGLNSAADPTATMSFWFPPRNQGARHHRRGRRAHTPIEMTQRDVYTVEIKQIGLLVNFFLLGYLTGMVPVMSEALYAPDSTEALRFANFMKTAQFLRVFFALFSDLLFASTQYRRRGMMTVVWIVTLALSATLTCLAWPSTTPSPTASDFAVPLMLLTVVQMIIGVSADGLMLEYAHQEELHDRGCVQMLLLATRTVGELIGRNLVSSGKTSITVNLCKGAIDCMVSPVIIFSMTASVSAIGLVSSIFATKVPTRRTSLSMNGSTLLEKAQTTFKFHARRVYVSFAVFGFVQAASFAWASPSAESLAKEWLNLSKTTLWMSDSFNRATQMLAALLMLFVWRNTSWRALTFISVTIISLGTDLPSSLLILLGASRSSAMFLVSHHVAQLCKDIAGMVRLLVAAELAMPNMEATSYAFTLTVFDLGTVGASIGADQLDASRPAATPIGVSASDLVIIMSVSLCVLQLVINVACLHLVPTQKAEATKRLQRSFKKNKWGYSLVLVLLLAVVVTAVVVSAKALIQGKKGISWHSELLH